MGRRSIYATDDERKKAKRQQNMQYAASERGRAQRSNQNHRAYEKRKGFRAAFLRRHRIPAFTKKLGMASVNVQPGRSLFNKYFNSKSPIPHDANEFALWEHPPPYSVSPHLIDVGIEDTIDALHGRRARIARDEEERILRRCQQGEDLMTLWQEVHDRLSALLRESFELKATLSTFDDSTVDHIMGMHLLQWKSRSILAYDNFWMAFKYGELADVENAFHSSWDEW